MPTEVITAIITAFTTLLVSIGTWHVTMRQYRATTNKSIIDAITDVKEYTRNELEGVKDDISNVNSNVQEHMAIIDLKVETLSSRVEKHNQLIERTYELEKNVSLNTSEIEHLKERIDRS